MPLSSFQKIFQCVLWCCPFLRLPDNQKGFDNYCQREANESSIEVPSMLKRQYEVSSLDGAACKTHVLDSKYSDEEPVILIFYIHGGALVTKLKDINLTGIGQLMELRCAVIFIPEYPILPASSRRDILDTLESTYALAVASRSRCKVVILGDSAGGGLALLLTQRLAMSNLSYRKPDSLILMSPWLDMSMSSPNCVELASLDPINSKGFLKRAGELFAMGPPSVSTKHPTVSPLFGSLSHLPATSVWTSTHDILLPDSQRLRDRFRVENVNARFRYHELDGMIHDWWLLGFEESPPTIRELINTIREDCNIDW